MSDRKRPTLRADGGIHGDEVAPLYADRWMRDRITRLAEYWHLGDGERALEAAEVIVLALKGEVIPRTIFNEVT